MYETDRAVEAGMLMSAADWRPCDPAWPPPVDGHVARCPGCLKPFHFNDDDCRLEARP